MALQTIETIYVADPSNPVEVQAWLTAHPLTVVTTVFSAERLFYIVHT